MKSWNQMSELEQAIHAIYHGHPTLSGTHGLAFQLRSIDTFWHQFPDDVKNYIKKHYDVKETDGQIIANL